MVGKIPDIAQCFRHMEEFAMLPNIRRHSVIVAKVAWLIVKEFNTSRLAGLKLPDQDLIIAGALLHDIAKTPCLKNGCDHAKAGGEICISLGYPEIASIVAEHVILKDHDVERYSQGIFSAREIIYYADKRVRHEEIVSLEDRLEYILEIYGNEDPALHLRIKENFFKCVQIEEHLFSFLPFQADQLADKVQGNSHDIPLFPLAEKV